MPRPILLFSGPFSDLPLSELVPKAAEWGYSGLELCTWGDHLEVQRALSDSEDASKRLSLLAAQDLQAPVVSVHKVGQCVCDPIDSRHKALVPDYVWGDGQPEGVRVRAAEEVIAGIRVAQQIGASVVSGFLGSPIWSFVAGYPSPDAATIDAGFAEFARRVHPILDACRDSGVRFALEVHPGQIAFDLYSAERTLEAIEHRDEFGFTFDPSHFHWQGVEPAEFVRQFPNRILHVHVKDMALQLDGRSSVLNSYLPYGDPRRGWEFRTPGRGGIAWESIIRALNEIGYDGPLSVDWRDTGMDREFAAAEACEFVRTLDFPRAAIRAQPQRLSRRITPAMENLTLSQIEQLRSEWTDQFVRANLSRPELMRFGETIGRVVTVNWNGKAVIDFQDGGWYDITASTRFLTKLDPADAKAKFDFKTNSAQPIPEKQS